jgi:ubiquinone/menaquinone biosynthesis C-methylase UbiE
MKLNNYINRHELLIDWILDSVAPGANVLDVGANDGSFCPEVRRVAEHAGVFGGVDPDAAKLERNPLLMQRFPGTLEEASIPDCSFDCIYAIYVLEHVAKERAFIRAASRVLRPGGSFFFITPNGYHYFAAIAALLARIGLQEPVLRLIRPRELIGRYHYPALYRLNTPRKLKRFGREAGFAQFEFRYSELLTEVACYFPGPLKVFPWLWECMVQATGSEWLLCNLMGRMVKSRG